MPSTAEPSSIPSLFGRASFVLSEHADLRVALAALRSQCSETSAANAPAPLPVRALMHDLRTKLLAHFAAEERDDYFGTLVSECPALARRVATLLADHRVLAALMDQLCALSDAAERPSDLAADVGRFIAHFEHHEHAEVAMLQEFLFRDEGSPGD